MSAVDPGPAVARTSEVRLGGAAFVSFGRPQARNAAAEAAEPVLAVLPAAGAQCAEE